MLWMENVRLRVSNDAKSEVLKLIETMKTQIRKDNNLLDWQSYQHAGISGDFSILIYWETTRVIPEGSLLAHNLIKILSPLGMVDHSIWIEQERLKGR